jgi:hypothetical protein
MQMATSRDQLQTVGYHINLTAKIFKTNISSTKTKTTAVCSIHIQTVNIVTNYSPVEQISDFKYLLYVTLDYTSDLEDNVQPYKKKVLYGDILENQ